MSSLLSIDDETRNAIRKFRLTTNRINKPEHIWFRRWRGTWGYKGNKKTTAFKSTKIRGLGIPIQKQNPIDSYLLQARYMQRRGN